MIEIKSRSVRETRDVAEFLTKELKTNQTARKSALVFALQGELGSGKTTFTQAFAKALGIKEKITSPTFVLIKIYNLQLATCNLKHFIHIDCYRLNSPEELKCLGFKKILKNKDTVMVVEWAERIRKLLPKDVVWIKFEYGNKNSERIINF